MNKHCKHGLTGYCTVCGEEASAAYRAQSPSPTPASAQGVTDNNREAFEREMRGFNLTRLNNGEYFDDYVRANWSGWKAALATHQPTAEAQADPASVQGERLTNEAIADWALRLFEADYADLLLMIPQMVEALTPPPAERFTAGQSGEARVTDAMRKAFDDLNNSLEADERDSIIAAILAAARPSGEPMFWVRLLKDGLYEGPVHHKSASGKEAREAKPDEWHPLYPHTSDDYHRGWTDGNETSKRAYAALSPTATQAAQPLSEDTERLDWVIDNAKTHGGGNGFTLTVFIPHDCECVRTAIDAVRGIHPTGGERE